MIVHDLHVLGSHLGPSEADPVLIVDPDGVLPAAVALELLQPETGKGEGDQRYGRVQLVEGLGGTRMKCGCQRLPGSLGVGAIEDVLGTSVLER